MLLKWHSYFGHLKTDGTSYFPDNPTGIIKHKRLTRHVERKITHIRASGTITEISICDAMEFAMYKGLRKEDVLLS